VGELDVVVSTEMESKNKEDKKDIVVEYRFRLLRKLNGIDVAQAGIVLGIAPTGRRSSLQIGGVEVESKVIPVEDGEAEQPGPSGRILPRQVGDAAQRFKTDVEMGKSLHINWARKMYVMPTDADEAVIEPMMVYRYAEKTAVDGQEVVAPAEIVGLSLTDKFAKPKNLIADKAAMLRNVTSKNVMLDKQVKLENFTPSQRYRVTQGSDFKIFSTVRTALIEEPLYYEGQSCNAGKNLSEKTSHLMDGLRGDGWQVTYYIGANAWPQDFLDRMYPNGSDGEDHYYGDNVALAVYSGHGNTAALNFSQSNANRCVAGGAFENNGIALGYGNGDKAANAIMLSCCFLNIRALKYSKFYESNGVTQIMGFGGIASFDADEVQDFYNRSFEDTNIGAWFSSMQDRPGWFTGDNTVVVLTNGWNDYDVNWNRANCKLKAGVCATDTWRHGPGYSVARYDYIDHGCSGCSYCY